MSLARKRADVERPKLTCSMEVLAGRARQLGPCLHSWEGDEWWTKTIRQLWTHRDGNTKESHGGCISGEVRVEVQLRRRSQRQVTAEPEELSSRSSTGTGRVPEETRLLQTKWKRCWSRYVTQVE